MGTIEKRARDILDSHVDGYWLEDQGKFVLAEEAVNAIISALTPPEGYVLVPVTPAYGMVKALADTAGCNLAYAALAYRDVLAARPEVNNVND